MRLQNEQVHSVTRLSPQAHFQTHNTYSREKRALRSDEHVVLTVAEVEQMEKLSWVSRCAVTAYDENGSNVVGDELTGSSPVSSLNSLLEADYSSATTWSSAGSVNSSGPVQPSLAVPCTTAFPSGHTGPSLSLDPAAADSACLGQIHCLPRGELGRFNDAGWDLSLGACISRHLRSRGTLAQGDCGPDSASMSVLGEAATALDAVAMRMEVLQYMLSKQGRAAYAFCQENEKEQPGRALKDVIEEGRAARDWVGHDWFTCFGSMLDLNVFVLSKLIRREQPVEVTYGIRLVTNAGAFIETDSANTVAVYYQGELPGGHERPPGHWESVWDEHGEHTWRHDDPTVQQCLLVAAQAMKLQVTRRQQVSKMLMAAENRNSNTNEVIQEGDIVWLCVPDKVIAAVKQQLRKTMEQQYTDRKMLVKVWKVTQVVSHFGRGVTQHFTILTQDGLLEDTYPIDELERCSAPPSTHPIVAMSASSTTRLSKRVALVTAYKAYCRWDAARSSIARKNKKGKTLGVSRRRHTLSSGAGETDASATGEVSQPPSSDTMMVDAALLQHAAVFRSSSSSSSSSDQPKHIVVEEDGDDSDGAANIPCCLCRMPLTADSRRCCMLNSCLRPFCAMNASCTRSVRVDELLVYCSLQCAQKDGKQLPVRRPVSERSSQPAPSRGSTAALPKPSYVWSSFTYTCNTCLLPITHDVKTWCNTCLKYVHNKTRGQPWCTRPGWSRGGTAAVDGLVSCIECRFARDEEWRCFTTGEVTGAWTAREA